jgi:serine/threonine-protein kinase
MTDLSAHSEGREPVSQLRRVDGICRSFERALQAGQRPRIEAALQEAEPADRPALFRELLAVEWAWRCQHGEAPSLEEYLARFPDQQAAISAWYAEQAPAAGPGHPPGDPRGAPLTALLEVLRRCALLTAKQREEFERTVLPHFREPQALLAELVRRTWLTRFQADMLRQGRPQDVKIGPYLILEPLGEGGMGQVFKARHRVMNRLVALKLVQPERLGNTQVVQRFLREVQAAARLSHPNIVTVHDANQVQGKHYLAMELIAGIDLAQWIEEQGQAPIAEACDYTRQAALGLQHAHEHHLVHRDIKPHNLMRTADGRTVKILDLGLALKSADTALTRQEGAMLGTVDYMAPEQVSNAHRVDERADVYSLGCTLYHFLAGRPPFADAHPVARPGYHLTQEPPPVEQFRPDLPEGLADVVRRMMAKQPGQRYQTAAEVAAALEPFTGPAPAETVTAVLPHPAPRPPAKAASKSGQRVRSVPPRRDTADRTVVAEQREPKSGRAGWWLMLLGVGVLLVAGGIGVTILVRRLPPAAHPSAAATGATVATEPTATPLKSTVRADDAERWFRRGNELFEKKEYDEAIAAYTEAIRLNPKHAAAYYSRGSAHARNGNTISAEADHRTALLLDPSLRPK